MWQAKSRSEYSGLLHDFNRFMGQKIFARLARKVITSSTWLSDLTYEFKSSSHMKCASEHVMPLLIGNSQKQIMHTCIGTMCASVCFVVLSMSANNRKYAEERISMGREKKDAVKAAVIAHLYS
jgi:hypothetical protein